MAEKGIMTRPFKRSPTTLQQELKWCQDYLNWDITEGTRRGLQCRIVEIQKELAQYESERSRRVEEDERNRRNGQGEQDSSNLNPVRKRNAVDWVGRCRFRRYHGRFPRLFEGHYIW